MKYLFKYYQIILLFCTISINAQPLADRAQIFVAYINNFARYTSWPDEDQTDSFNIVVFSDNTDIINELKEFSKIRKIKDKPVIVSEGRLLSGLGQFRMVLVTQDKSELLLEIYNAIEGKPVLLVSENYEDKRTIMINLYETPEKQLLFEVNKANIINQNLIINPEILLAGGTEIDVAGLFRKSQLNLQSMKKELNKMKDSLKNVKDSVETLSSSIQMSLNQINEQHNGLIEQKLLLTEREKQIKSHELKIDFQRAILSSYKDSIKNKNNLLQKQLQEVRDMEKYLLTKQGQIEILNKEIENKNTILGNQLEIIARQKLMLVLFVIIGVLSIFLVISVFNSYRINKHKKDILAKQKNEIIAQLEEVRQLNIKLERADQYKSIFLASMSHELRTPLNSIIGYTGILLMGMTGELNEEQNKQLGKVKNNARHLLSLINDILDISKIEAGRVELHHEEFNIRELIKEIADIIHPKVIEKGLSLTVESLDDLDVYTDKRRLKQVVLNLAINAVNYTGSGNIHIDVRRITDNKFTISVKDTGSGIPESELPRLFQPFQQIDSSLTKKNKGTGLGLYLCKKLMTLLGGNIFVKSEFGVGSEFYIEMPVKI